MKPFSKKIGQSFNFVNYGYLSRIRWNIRITEKEQQTVSDVAFEVKVVNSISVIVSY